jgi:hypothetical protein
MKTKGTDTEGSREMKQEEIDPDEYLLRKVEGYLNHAYELGKFDGKHGSNLKDNLFELAERFVILSKENL